MKWILIIAHVDIYWHFTARRLINAGTGNENILWTYPIFVTTSYNVHDVHARSQRGDYYRGGGNIRSVAKVYEGGFTLHEKSHDYASLMLEMVYGIAPVATTETVVCWLDLFV